MSRAPVVVGVDGSESSLAAVGWAAREAAARGTGLRVVHAFIWPMLHVPLGPASHADPGGGLRADARALLADAVHRAKAVADVEVTGDMPESAPVPALLRQDACLVVLGSRGLGGFGGLLLGSTAVQVAAHARCPVVVVRGERSGDVVVGVDGSAHSVEAIAFAFGEAQRLGAGVIAVTAGSQEDEAERALAESVAGWAERYPDVPVRRSVVRGHAARALVDAAADAALLVVGSRGAGGFRGMLLGSVSQGVLHHATCPVAIVRSP